MDDHHFDPIAGADVHSRLIAQLEAAKFLRLVR
jgi:hypothetical protein